jgi:hypothetical protein
MEKVLLMAYFKAFCIEGPTPQLQSLLLVFWLTQTQTGYLPNKRRIIAVPTFSVT